MGGITVGEQELLCEQVARDDAEASFVLRIEYERGSTVGVDRVDLDVDSRMGVTEAVVTEAIREWRSNSGRKFVRSFEVYERIECRRGGPTDETREQWQIGEAGTATDRPGRSSRSAKPRIDEPVEFSGDDLVAYYVQGPDSTVYGYVAEARVEKAPPWTKGSPGQTEWFVDSAVLERGGDTKEIPLAWIIGTTDDDEVAAMVDRPYDAE